MRRLPHMHQGMEGFVVYHFGDSLVCLDTCEAYTHTHTRLGPLSGPLVAVPFEYPLGIPLSLLGDTRL